MAAARRRPARGRAGGRSGRPGRADGLAAAQPGPAQGGGPRGLPGPPAHRIDLLPSHQRRGHGSRLLERLVRELAGRGTPALHVGMLTSNTPARAFYDRLGFHRIPIEDSALTYLGLEVGR
ncbi:GNAT family N-acetyltransferase [Actinospica durhamensis]|uniref:GNAT family N-acetyltransferase n=1 Tax=Actinospica durhamensis TaxID=1508375 RepID=A0A941IRV9_9ACTN|nr:GNAT family N-acetyltransferase [Actinospica durhamensis]